MTKIITAQYLDQLFARLEAAALAEARCPQNAEIDGGSTAVLALAHAGKIKIEVSGKNWRTVTLLVGPHVGKTTQRDPSGGHIYKTITTKTASTPRPQVSSEPSAPRALTREELERTR